MPEVRPIDANALMENVCENCPRYDCTPDATDTVYGCMFADSIEAMPTIEPEVRHGRWIFVGEETMHDGWTYRKHKCTECGFSTVEAKNFCQNCGAKMDLRTPTEVALDIADSVMMEGAEVQNESWFTDDFNRCDNCPDWDDEKGCKSHGKGCDFEGPDNECI